MASSPAELLAAVTRIQRLFTEQADAREAFEELLSELLRLTQSEYGFVGEVLHDEDDNPFLRTFAISNIAWNAEMRQAFESQRRRGLEFRNLHSLFGRVLVEGVPLMANAPATDPRRGGLPAGHPPLLAFLGVPLHVGDRMVGMIGVANRPGGYDDEVLRVFEPFFETTATLVERVRSRRAAVEAFEEVQRSRNGLALAIAATDMGIWSWEVEGNRVQWDDRMCRHFRVPREHAPTNYEEYVALLPPEDRDEVTSAIGRAIASGHFEDVIHRIRAGDEIRFVLAKAHVERDESGQPLRVIGGTFDITERRRLEEQVRQGQKLEAVGELAAGIAHNINNVLTGMLACISLASRKASPEVAALLEQAIIAGERGAQVVRQVSSFARPADEDPADPVALPKIVHDTANIARSTFGPRIELVVEQRTSQEPWVAVSANVLEHVLLNLCINARDAIDEARREQPRIVVSIEDAPPMRGDDPRRWVCIAITDNGVGMVAAVRERVFEPFYTTKGPGRGTGLGLSTAYRSVRSAGGLLDCVSTPGVGTTFQLLLPTVEPPQREDLCPRPVVDGRGRTVLLVDDDPLIRASVGAVISAAGYHVLMSSDGDDALRQLDGAAIIDLVVIDRMMPGRPVFEVLEAMRQRPCPIPTVLFTGSEVVPDERALVDAVLPKPAGSDLILKIIAEVLQAPVWFDEARGTKGRSASRSR